MKGFVPMTLIITSRPEELRRVFAVIGDDFKSMTELKLVHYTESLLTTLRIDRTEAACLEDQIARVVVLTEEELAMLHDGNVAFIRNNSLVRVINEFDRVAVITADRELLVIKERPIPDSLCWRDRAGKLPELKPDTSVADVQRMIDAYCAEINHTGPVAALFDEVKIDPNGPLGAIIIKLTTSHGALAQRLKSLGFVHGE